MIAFTHELSHEWQRRRVLQEPLLIDDHLDAHHFLLTAADVHGWQVEAACPVCGGDALHHVMWVYGDNLGRRSGTARSMEEIERLVHEVGPITVHLVEVCRHCKWNFLLKESTAVMPR